MGLTTKIQKDIAFAMGKAGKFIAKLDALLGFPPNLDEDVFEALFQEYGEQIAEMNVPEDDDEGDGFSDSTLKHQVFNYGVSCRSRFVKHGTNDIANKLADFAGSDKDLQREILQVAYGAKLRSLALQQQGAR
jgi:hypothetical protein